MITHFKACITPCLLSTKILYIYAIRRHRDSHAFMPEIRLQDNLTLSNNKNTNPRVKVPKPRFQLTFM